MGCFLEEPTKIDDTEFDRLFDMWENGGTAPRDTWYIDNGNSYIGIDNADGCFFVEEFGLLDYCIDWLKDYEVAAWEYDSYVG